MSEITQEVLDRLLTVAELATLKNTTAGVVRREAKKGNIPGLYMPWKKMGFDSEAVADWTPPTGSARILREDGRRKFTAWLNDEEVTTLSELGIEVVDPRIAAKARRDARKAAAAADTAPAEAEGPADDLFGNFGNS